MKFVVGMWIGTKHTAWWKYLTNCFLSVRQLSRWV